MPTLRDVRTPALVLDRAKLRRNTLAMSERMRRLGVALRPHLKTAKSAEVARLATDGHFGGITVSTLAEAAFFVQRGWRDVTYAVGIVPDKLDAVAALQRDGARMRLLTDDVGVARALGARAAALDTEFDVLVEVDTGGGRGGVEPDSQALLDIASILHAAPGTHLAGVLTHAGHSYHCASVEAVRAVAVAERDGVVRAARRLRAAGLPCATVSAGSTPTAVHATSLEGVTEMRPGNYVFFDLAQVGLRSCTVDDIAVSVLATVIGHAAAAASVLVDAGSLALSADTSANERLPGSGFGRVCDLAGRPLDGLRVARVNQEHGFVVGDGAPPFAALPIGTRVRILPNHSCITAAMFDAYHVVDAGDRVEAVWERARGW